MDVSMINAWRIHQAVSQNGHKMSRLTFMESVLLSLVGGRTVSDEAVAGPAPTRARVDPKSPPVSHTVGQHWPISGSKDRCVECYASGRTTKRSRILCERCGVHLHLDCFKQWHTKEA